MPRLAAGLRLVSAIVVCAGAATAQPAGNLQIDTFRPAMDSRGYLTINASQTLGHGEVSFGLGSLAWGHGLLHFDGPAGATYSVDDVFTATLIGAVGLRIGPVELEIGASLPLTLLSGDRGPDDLGVATDPNDDKRYGLAAQGLGNAGLHLKTRLLKPSRSPYIGVGAIASVVLPTARPEDRFLGETRRSSQLIGVIDKELGRLRISFNGGIRLREPVTFTDRGDGGAPATGGTITASMELPFGVGVAYAVKPAKFDIVGEVFGALPRGAHENYGALEAVGGVKLYLARNSFLSLGAGRGLGTSPAVRAFIGIVFEPSIADRDGDGLADDVDKCPDAPEDFDKFEDEDGCPEPDKEGGHPEGDANDRDLDTILDDVDACPDDPEDFDQFEDADGCPDLDNDKDRILDLDDLCPNDPEDDDNFEDEDGCPDLDNDRDRILDKDDKCPNEPETYNNKEDEDGCPDRDGYTKLVDGAVVILEPINFELDSEVILATSFPVLDAVVASVQGNPEIELVEVQGHTDEQGSDAHNLDLSRRRAASVVRYLTMHGVDGQRLESQGYGESQPKVHAHTQAAYATNRRVEFVILRRSN